jgi:flagellar motility protein MotE (MotC chaperone)
MPRFTARRLVRTLSEVKRPPAPPLNFEKWRGELRDIRNQLIKLRDKSEDELDRLEKARYDDEELTPSQNAKLEKLYDRMEDAVDNIAQAINNIDYIL